MKWYQVKNLEKILSPALLFYSNRVSDNIKKMLEIAGTPDRLRPHIKTYKCAEIVKMQLDVGIDKFKCATLSEAQLLAKNGVKDILVAYPLVGPNQQKLIELVAQYPKTKFSSLVDNRQQIKDWNRNCESPINVFIDVNVGMNRTGIKPESALEIYQQIKNNTLNFKGLHVYDGHIHNQDFEERKLAVKDSFFKVIELISAIQQFHTADFEVVCGGSITFPAHALIQNRNLSPGTTLLWDYGNSSKFPDLKFNIAAVLLTRIISKPSKNSICIDLGHKAVASEMNDLRVYFPQIPNAKRVGHSEEHLMLEIENSDDWNIGDVLYGFPWHICPTVALHEQVGVIEGNKLIDYWKITARKRLYK